MGEIQAIPDAYPQIRGTLFFADAALYGPHEFSKDAPMPKARGGGGTAFEPFFDWVAQQERGGTQSLCIYFTDGYGSFPKAAPESPVLWVVVPGGWNPEAFRLAKWREWEQPSRGRSLLHVEDVDSCLK